VLEPYAGKLARAVLRGEGGREASDLPGPSDMKKIIILVIFMSFFSKVFAGQQNKYNVAEIYTDLRNQIISLSDKEKAKDFGYKEGQTIAVLMETGLEDACYTLVAVSDGTASLYFSNGGGIIGAGEYEKGARAAHDFIQFSGKFEQYFSITKKYPLPQPGKTRFYIIKSGTILTGEYNESDLGNGKLVLSPLFYKGHDLITEIRVTEEKRKKGEQPN